MISLLGLSLAVSCQSGEPTEDRPDGVTVLVGSRPVVKEASLFPFDNGSIPFTQNVGLELHPPRKYPGNPVLPRGSEGAPDEFGVQFYGSVVRHEGKVQALVRGHRQRSLYGRGEGPDVDPPAWTSSH